MTPLCKQTRKICNPVRVQFCLCWWESVSTADFLSIARARLAEDIIREPERGRGSGDAAPTATGGEG